LLKGRGTMLRFTLSISLAVSALAAGACLDQPSTSSDDLALDRDCFCTREYAPVCGADGITHGNACMATCAGATVVAQGECGAEEPEQIFCPAIFQPVCGVDGQTYSNACRAAAAHAAVAYDGECEAEQVFCPQVYQPVCAGTRTYGNACEAAAAQAIVTHDGECGITGDQCGGFAGFPCAEGFECRFDGANGQAAHPDQAGSCVPANYCEATSECGGFPNTHVPGSWACVTETHTCAWQTSSGWYAVPGWRFSSGSPYAALANVAQELTAPAGATKVRLSFIRNSGFSLERGYDFLRIQKLVDGEWRTQRSFTGTEDPTRVTVVLGAAPFRVLFESDDSVAAAGFDLALEYSVR
jgi:hypothetical protein